MMGGNEEIGRWGEGGGGEEVNRRGVVSSRAGGGEYMVWVTRSGRGEGGGGHVNIGTNKPGINPHSSGPQHLER